MCFPSSYGNQKLSRTPKIIKNLNQYDFELGRYSIRNESQLLNFIETTMETYLIPGMQISIVKGGNIVWNKHFGYANIDENILVDENTMFILSSASKAITASALMHAFELNLFSVDVLELWGRSPWSSAALKPCFKRERYKMPISLFLLQNITALETSSLASNSRNMRRLFLCSV